MKRYIRSDINVPIKDLSTKAKVQLARTSDDIEVLKALVKDKSSVVKNALAQNPNYTDEMEVEAWSFKNLSTNEKVNRARTSSDPEFLDDLATKERSYRVLCAVARNPNTSIQTIRKLIERAETAKFMQGWQGDTNPRSAVLYTIVGRKDLPEDILNYLIENHKGLASTLVRTWNLPQDVYFKIASEYYKNDTLMYWFWGNDTAPDIILEYMVQSEYSTDESRERAAERLGISEEELENIELTDLSFDEFMAQS